MERISLGIVSIGHQIPSSMSHVILLLTPAGYNIDSKKEEVRIQFQDLDVSVVVLTDDVDSPKFSFCNEDTCKYWYEQIANGRVIMAKMINDGEQSFQYISSELEKTRTSSRTLTARWGNWLVPSSAWAGISSTNAVCRSQLIFTYAACKFGIPTSWTMPSTSFVLELDEWKWLKRQVPHVVYRDGVIVTAFFGVEGASEAVTRSRAWARPRAGAS